MNLDSIIKKYRSIIIERLYQPEYELERIVNLSDGCNDYIFVIYKRRKKCQSTV